MIKIFILNFFIISTLTYLGYLLLETRISNNKFSIFIFLITYICLCTVNYNDNSYNSEIQIFILYLLYVIIQFKGKTLKKLLLIILFSIITAIFEISVGLIFNLNIGFKDISSIKTLSYPIALLFSNILVFIFIFFFRKIKKFYSEISLPMYPWLIFSLPIIIAILIIDINNYYYLLDYNSSLLIIIIGLFISNFILIIIFINTVKNINIKNELESEKYRHQYSQTKYALLDQQYKNNFDLLHNLMNKCYRLNESLKIENYQKAKFQAEELIEITFKQFNTIYTNSVVINTLISNRIDVIKKYNLIINSTIEYNDYTFMDFCDQIDLFSNLLDYSMQEAINSIEYRNIVIKSEKTNNQIIICFQFANNNNKTRESDLISSINHLTNKYGAAISTYSLNEKIHSIIIIFLNN